MLAHRMRTSSSSGMVWCGKCGGKMTQTRGKNRFTSGQEGVLLSLHRQLSQSPGEVPAAPSTLGAIRLEEDAWAKVLAFLLEPELLEMHLANLEPAKALSSVPRIGSRRRREKCKGRSICQVKSRHRCTAGLHTSKLVQRTLKEKLSELDAEAKLN